MGKNCQIIDVINLRLLPKITAIFAYYYRYYQFRFSWKSINIATTNFVFLYHTREQSFFWYVLTSCIINKSKLQIYNTTGRDTGADQTHTVAALCLCLPCYNFHYNKKR